MFADTFPVLFWVVLAMGEGGEDGQRDHPSARVKAHLASGGLQSVFTAGTSGLMGS